MSTQYDTIGATYEEMRKLPAAQLQDYSFRKALAPYMKGTKVLDLACGTGYYSRTALELGAASVIGVDISPGMIEAAKALTASSKVTFQVADCSKPVIFDGGPFDLVLGAWLLNYAPNATEMRDMYRTVAMNLKQGGRFLGVTPHPTNDPKGHENQATAVRPIQNGNVTMLVKNEVEDGVATHLVAVTPSGKIEFEGFHLTKDVYERCAREGGMTGELIWKPLEFPAGESWDSFLEVPHFGILDLAKSSEIQGPGKA